MLVFYCNYKSKHKFRVLRNTNLFYSWGGHKFEIYFFRLKLKAIYFLEALGESIFLLAFASL